MGVTNLSSPPGNPGAPTLPNGSSSAVHSSTNLSAQKIPDILVNMNRQGCDPVLYRDAVVTQLMTILIGKKKPNALLIGMAGTGKTAIVEELARRIEQKDPSVPPALTKKTVYSLQCSDMVSGSSFVGQLEEKVNDIVKFLSEPKNEAIVFIDEIHQLFEQSKGVYQTIAQILKPALSRGCMRVIGATTTQEAKNLSTDPAFNRRFNRVLVDELSKEQTAGILMSAYPGLVRHYNATFALPEETVRIIVDTADEFCTAGSHRPDNAITLLDRCVASAVIDKQQMLASPDPQIQALAKAMPGVVLSETGIRKTALKIATGNNEPADFSEEKFKEDFAVIRGQDHILEPLLRIMKRHTAHLRPQRRPLTLLFMGASGTGKTEVTKILARNYLNEKPIILNMTEYTDPASINRIIGAPAGFVGFNDNDELPFDPLDTNPYQVILLDEFEKAHPSVQTLFMQVFDEGCLKTSRGKEIDFTKTVIVATTNAGCTNDAEKPIGFIKPSAADPTDEQIIKTLSGHFKIELLNRFTRRMKFRMIERDTFIAIAKDTYLAKREEVLNLRPSMKLPDILSQADAEELADRYYERTFGARPVNEAVDEYIDRILVP